VRVSVCARVPSRFRGSGVHAPGSRSLAFFVGDPIRETSQCPREAQVNEGPPTTERSEGGGGRSECAASGGDGGEGTEQREREEERLAGYGGHGPRNNQIASTRAHSGLIMDG